VQPSEGLIRSFRAWDFMGDDTQAVGAGLGLRRTVGAGEPGGKDGTLLTPAPSSFGRTTSHFIAGLCPLSLRDYFPFAHYHRQGSKMVIDVFS
jgi:hypothetical protein